MTALLIIFAKEPRPGQVKNRLSRLCPGAAAQLYHRFILDILDEMARVPKCAWPWPSAPNGRGFFRRLAPPGTNLSPGGADLGERMARAFARSFAAGFGPVLLRAATS